MHLIPAALALLSLTLYAIHDVIIKHLSAHYEVIEILFFATLFSFPLISAGMLTIRSVPSLRPNRPGLVAFRSLTMVIILFSAFYAFQNLQLAETYALLFTSPLIIAALSSPLLGEKVGISCWISIFCGFVGVLIVLQPNTSELSLGHVAALTASLLNSINNVVIRKLGTSEPPIILIIYPLAANMIAMSMLLPVVYRPIELVDLALTALLSVLALVGAFLNILAYRWGTAKIVAPMHYSQILWGILFGITLFGEYPSTSTMIGALVIILSGIYVVFHEQFPRRG